MSASYWTLILTVFSFPYSFNWVQKQEHTDSLCCLKALEVECQFQVMFAQQAFRRKRAEGKKNLRIVTTRS